MPTITISKALLAQLQALDAELAAKHSERPATGQLRLCAQPLISINCTTLRALALASRGGHG